jgi:hypothetical protein
VGQVVPQDDCGAAVSDGLADDELSNLLGHNDKWHSASQAFQCAVHPAVRGEHGHVAQDLQLRH